MPRRNAWSSGWVDIPARASRSIWSARAIPRCRSTATRAPATAPSASRWTSGSKTSQAVASASSQSPAAASALATAPDACCSSTASVTRLATRWASAARADALAWSTSATAVSAATRWSGSAISWAVCSARSHCPAVAWASATARSAESGGERLRAARSASSTCPAAAWARATACKAQNLPAWGMPRAVCSASVARAQAHPCSWGEQDGRGHRDQRLGPVAGIGDAACRLLGAVPPGRPWPGPRPALGWPRPGTGDRLRAGGGGGGCLPGS